MTEGVGGKIAITTIDSSDVFNPKVECRNCGAENDISVVSCAKCGQDIYGADRMSVEVEDTTMGSRAILSSSDDESNEKGKSKFKHLWSGNAIASLNPDQQMIVPAQSEGMSELDAMDEFLDDAAEGVKDQNNDDNNGLQNMRGVLDNYGNASPHRPLFTLIFSVYWLYFFIWSVLGIVLSTRPQLVVPGSDVGDFNIPINMFCIILPSLSVLAITSRVACLNTANLSQINRYQNLSENSKQKYRLVSFLVSIVLASSAFLRIIWWIYCIITYVHGTIQVDEEETGVNDTFAKHQWTVTVITLCFNEFIMLVYMNIDFLKMSFFEKNRPKQGLFGIVHNPYACVFSLSSFLAIQFWILTYGAYAYESDNAQEDCADVIRRIFICEIRMTYFVVALVAIIIPILALLQKLVAMKQEQDPNVFSKLSKCEKIMVWLFCLVLILASMALFTSVAVSVVRQEQRMWIHLLVLPQLAGLIWALYKATRM